MIRRPPRSTLDRSSAASDVYKRQIKDSLKIYPNGPAANQFPYMTFDKSGNLWSSSGKNGSGIGINKFDGSNWEIYDVNHYPILYQNDYYSIFCASDNSIFSGNWGQGFVKIKDNNIQRFHSGNSPMIGIPGSPSSVSYTHLRAHETVLDLVCRLLLEKKQYT